MLQFSAMSPDANEPDEKQGQRSFGYILAAITGQVGCLTAFLLLAALFGGIWLDDYLGTKPLFTIGLIILSVPITIAAILWIVKKMTSRIQSTQRGGNPSQLMEEDQSG